MGESRGCRCILSIIAHARSPLYCDTRGCQELTKWHRSAAGSEGVTFAANYMLRVRDRERERKGEIERERGGTRESGRS